MVATNRKPSIRTLAAFVLLICASAFAITALGETSVFASVDRNQLHQSQLLNLTLQAESELDSPLGGLMNFGGRQIESPEFDGLEQDWEVVDRQQSYNMSTVNGKGKSTITWQYTLSPKRAGELTVPPARFKDGSSSAININVLPGSPPRDASNPPSIFLKAEVDKTSAYVQEQIVFTLSLYTLGQVANGDMSEPSHPDIIAENLGETTKTFKMAYNRRYEVHERSYLLFPQKSGTLQLDPQTFAGTYVPVGARRMLRAREASNAVELQIKAPPSGFTGDTWLPATSLHLSETLSPDLAELEVGSSITRRIDIKALGLLGSALPPLQPIQSELLKIYPDKPETTSVPHKSGVEATRVETSALVAIREGEIILPEVRIPWWDTVNNIERVAIIPQRNLRIIAAANSGTSTQIQEQSTDSTIQTEALSETSHSREKTQPSLSDDSSTEERDGLDQTQQPTSSEDIDWYWYLIISSLIIGWAMHVTYLTKKIRRGYTNSPKKIENALSLRELKKLMMPTNADCTGWVCKYLSQSQNTVVTSLEQVKQINQALYNLLCEIENATYRPNQGSSKHELEDLKKSVLEELARLNKTARTEPNNAHLAPLYP